MKKQDYDKYSAMGIPLVPVKEMVSGRVCELLDALFIPTPEGMRRDPKRCELFGIAKEPINWGDLSCAEVISVTDEEFDFIVTVEECSPNECPSLCSYIETYMGFLGWKVKCQTEW